MPIARDGIGIFLAKTPSLSRFGTSHQEGQREECEVDIQLIFGGFVLDIGEGVDIFINPLLNLGDQGGNRETDLEIPPRNMAEEEEQPEQLGGYEFPIREPTNLAHMKNINPDTLPNFHGLIPKDLDTFLFEFEVVCRTYEYLPNAQNLNIFSSTLKDLALRWFMSL